MDDRILHAAPTRLAPDPPPGVKTLPDLLRWQAETTPHAPLLSISTSPSGPLRTLSYAQVVAQAEAAAKALRRRCGLDARGLATAAAEAAPVFAVWCEKSIELHLALFATTCAGATWLPFDPDVPASRVTTCVADASARLVLCDAAHAQRAREAVDGLERGTVVDIVVMEELLAEVAASSTAPSSSSRGGARPDPNHAAYFIYTSGTTGTPKGISIPHRAALLFALSERSVLGTCPTDTVWQGFSPAFDMFVEETWVSIAGGAHLVVGTREECQDISGLGGDAGLWATRGVTVVNAVPTLMGIMATLGGSGSGGGALPDCVRLVNLGGEACPPALVERIARPGHRRLINTYGPSECTVTATYDELVPGRAVTIGKPLPSYTACILPIADDDGAAAAASSSPQSLLPLQLGEGVEGELAIGGPCVGDGYVGRPELTEKKFIRHPLLGEGEMLYRTGDRVVLDAQHNIVFLGRIDTQVKHRGFRIELGEIESALSDHKDVRAAACILANADGQNARLEAFVVLTDDAAKDLDEARMQEALRSGALRSLPAYMHPEAFFYLAADEMPRLPSGKINAKALHDVSRKRAEEAAAAAAAARTARGAGVVDATDAPTWDPSTPLGRTMTALSAIFPQAGSTLTPQADFFVDLGGHSLAAAMLVNRLRQEGGSFSTLGLTDVYSARTAEEIASRVSSQEALLKPDGGADDDALGADSSDAGATVRDHLPISRARFVACGVAQSVSLLLFFFLHSLEILVPYLVFDYLIRRLGIGIAIVASYGVFVAVPVFLSLVAVVGKWLSLGRAKAGEYPVYGLYYFRWWLAERFVSMVRQKAVAGSPLYPTLLRMLGARVGSHCHLGVIEIGAAVDLLSIGSDVVVGSDVVMATALVERGRLVLRPIRIGDDAIVGGNSVVEGGSVIQRAGELGCLSVLPCGEVLRAGQVWSGSPAVYQGEAKEPGAGRTSRPSAARHAYVTVASFLVVTFVMPILYMAPQLPGLMLFDLLDLRTLGGWVQTAIVAPPVAMGYTILVFVELLAFRWLFLGRLKPGEHSVWSTFYVRKWFVERLMDASLDILQSVYATLYVVPFLRLLGTPIGAWAEVSTARGINFELTEIGAESFVADSVWMGGDEVRANKVTLKRTKLEPRAFAGNASFLPAGTTLPTGSLVGVLSIAPPPDRPLAPSQSCFGSPPVLMPARQAPETQHADHLLYHPRPSQVALRLLIEGLRIFLPRALVVFGIGFGLQIIYTSYAAIGHVYTLLMLPAYYFFMFALPALVFTAACKWLLVGRYRPASWPLWSHNVWLSEFVTSTFESLAEPLLVSMLIGTPMLAWWMRLLGAHIGSRAVLLSSDMTEMDLVTVGDEATLNRHCGPQTHLFSDRIMTLGEVRIGARATMRPYCIALPNSCVEDDAQLGSLSLLMKNERIGAGTAWEGAPVQPRRRRRVYTEAELDRLAGEDGVDDDEKLAAVEAVDEAKTNLGWFASFASLTSGWKSSSTASFGERRRGSGQSSASSSRSTSADANTAKHG